MTTGGMPLHHHQQHQLNMQHSGYNMNVNQQGLPMNTHSQQQQRRAGKNQQQAGTGVGQYGYPAFPSAGGAASNASGSRGDSQQQDSDFVLDLKRIGDDEETRTTVMVHFFFSCSRPIQMFTHFPYYFYRCATFPISTTSRCCWRK